MSLIEFQRPGDRYGYYQIGSNKTYLKSELIDWHNSMPVSWKWNYNDEFFARNNWRIEPNEDIQELYRQRALELREKYDYLILYYSGGHDCSNILYAFLENNIAIDEICTFYSSYDSVSLMSKEHRTITRNKIKWLKIKYPNLKIRTIDYGDACTNWSKIASNYGCQDDLMTTIFGGMISINRIVVDEFYMLVPDWKKLLDLGKKVAWIFGIEKPMIRYNNNQWIFNFHDSFIHSTMSPLRRIYDNGSQGTYEFFYWGVSDFCQKIIRKQCHLLVNVFNEQAKNDFRQIPGAKPFQPGYGWSIDTLSQPFLQTIYPRLFQFGEKYFLEKNSKFIFGNRDQWYYGSNHDGALLHQDLINGLNGPLNHHYKDWMNNGINIDDGVRSCLSQDYIIKDNNTVPGV